MHAPVGPAVLKDREPPFAEFVALVALMMGITAFGVDNALPAFPALGRHFAVEDANELQLVVYVYMLGFGLAQLLYGPAADVLGRRPTFLFGLVVFAIGCVAATFAPNFTALLLARFLQGLGSAAGRVLAIAIVRDRFAGREMSRIMSLTMMVFIMVPIFAPAIGSLLLVIGDWHAIFGSMFVLAVALGGWFAVRMPETLSPENRRPFSATGVLDGFRQAVACRPALGYSTAFGLMFGTIMSYVGSSQQIFAEDVYHLGAWFPLAFGSIALMMGLSALLNSRLVRRYGMQRISHAAMFAFMGLALLQAGFALLYGGHPPLFLFAGLLGLSHFATSLAMPNFNAMAMEPLGQVAGTASSFIGFYTTLIGSLVGAFVGHQFNGTVTPLALGYAALSIAAVAVVLLTERGRLFRSSPDRLPLERRAR